MLFKWSIFKPTSTAGSNLFEYWAPMGTGDNSSFTPNYPVIRMGTGQPKETAATKTIYIASTGNIILKTSSSNSYAGDLSLSTSSGKLSLTSGSADYAIRVKDKNTNGEVDLSDYPIKWSAIDGKKSITSTHIGYASYLNGSTQYGTIGISVYNYNDKSTKYYLFDHTGVWKEFTVGVGFSFDEYKWAY